MDGNLFINKNVQDFLLLLNEKEISTERIIKLLIQFELHKLPTQTTQPEVFSDLISNIAKIKPAVALSFGMHLYSVWGMKYVVSQERWKEICKLVNESDILFSSLNEPGLFFVNMNQVNPSHYPINATRDKEGNYIVNGEKRFVSLEPFVDILPVYALIEEENMKQLTVLLINKKQEGVTIKKSWDTISMEDTHSNDIILQNVKVANNNIILEGKDAMNKTAIFGYLFRYVVSSVYLGIANSVVENIKSISKEKIIPHYNVLLGQLPGPQFSFARMIILQETMKSQLADFSSKIKQYPCEDIEISSLVTKQYIAESAKEIVNLAMKIEGISSIGNGNKLSKMYKDVAAAMFHPPQTDVLLEIIAKKEIGLLTKNKRWI